MTSKTHNFPNFYPLQLISLLVLTRICIGNYVDNQLKIRDNYTSQRRECAYVDACWKERKGGASCTRRVHLTRLVSLRSTSWRVPLNKTTNWTASDSTSAAPPTHRATPYSPTTVTQVLSTDINTLSMYCVCLSSFLCTFVLFVCLCFVLFVPHLVNQHIDNLFSLWAATINKHSLAAPHCALFLSLHFVSLTVHSW